MNRWVPWGSKDYRLDRLLDVSADDSRLLEARERAAAHEPPTVYKRLTYTEQIYLWTLLYSHLLKGQIEPQHLRRMRAADLEYIAAAQTHVHDELDEEEKAKLLGNVARATRELQRRYTVLTGLVIAVAAAIVGWAFAGI